MEYYQIYNVNDIYIFYQQMKGYRADKSPRKEAIDSELDEHSNRIKELLRADITMLEEQNAILKTKCKKVSELQGKIEKVLNQNSELLNENEQMGTLLHEQRSQNEILKNKLDAYASQRHGAVSELEADRKRLLKEIQNMKYELSENSALSKNQMHQLRTQFQMEMQAAQRQFSSAEHIYENEVRKLREQLEKREHEVNEYASKIKRISTENEYEILRHKEEKEKLKNDLLFNESDRKKQVQNLRAKLQANYYDEIQTLKRSHLHTLQEMDIEMEKYKITLQERNGELDELSFKFNKQRTLYEDSIGALRRETDTYRLKISEIEQITDIQLDQMKRKLTDMHQNQLTSIKVQNQRQTDSLIHKMQGIEDIVVHKQSQIDALVKERTTTRGQYERDMNKMKDQYAFCQNKLKQAESKLTQTISKMNGRIVEKQKQNEYVQRVSKEQKQALDKDISSLKGIIEAGKKELQMQQMVKRQAECRSRQQINALKNENVGLREAVRHERNERQKVVTSLQGEMVGASSQLSAKVEAVMNSLKIIQKENEALKNALLNRDKEMKNMVERLKASQEREKKLSAEVDEMRVRSTKKEEKGTALLADQRDRMEKSFNYSLESMRVDHESALKLQAMRNADLNDKLRRKERELEELLKRYKQMTDQVEVLVHQEANKKDITLKYPGASANLIANKHIFDVFLKTKVLDLCGDALYKENVVS